MKINRFLWGMIAALAVIVSGCDDDDEENLGVPSISASESSLSFSQDGGATNAQTIVITSSRDWTASADEDWVIVSPTSGSAASGTTNVTVYVEANTSNDRTAKITFATTTVSTTVSVSQSGPDGEVETGSGTKSDPYTVAGALAIINAGTYTSSNVYVKGIISQIDEIDTSSHGNATYYISDDGTTTSHLEVYRGYSLGGVKFTSEDEIVVGDTVIVYGELTMYNTTPEITQGSSIYYLNGVTSDVGYDEDYTLVGSGTVDDPYTPEDANYLCQSETYTSDYVYVKGIISEISKVDTSYGNATYYISNDGTTDDQFYIFRGYYLGNTKFTSEDQIAVGDEVIIYGVLTMYYSTPETTSGSYIYSLNGETSGSGSGSIESTYVYYNNFDAEAATQVYGSSGSSWPYLDQFDGWKNESGTGIEDVSYSYTNLSVRNNSSSNGTYSVYDGSGTNNLFFGSVTNYFVIYDIELTSGVVDYTLSFGSERYEYNVSDNTFNHDEFHVYVSEDGNRWVELSYTFASGDQSAKWDLASTTFTVSSSVEDLCIYFTADVASAYRLDDVILATSSESGTAIDFSTGVKLGGDTSGGDTYTLSGAGTAEDPYTVADALYLTNNNLYTSDYVYVKGIISKISEVSTSYGNASYYISADGTETDEFYIFRGYYLGNTKFTSGDQIAVGDEVIVYGVLTLYSSSIPEMISGNYIYSLNGETEADSGDSTVSGTIAEILAADSGSTVSTTGVVVASYNRGFVLSDDTANVLCYNTSTSGFEIGANVTITGTLSSYGNLPQIAYSDDDVTTNSTGNKVTYPEPTVITADNIATYAGVWGSCDYIQFEGTLAISGNYYNVTIDDTSVKGSISYPSQDLTDYSGVKATYTGYFAGGSSASYLNMLLVEVEAAESTLAVTASATEVDSEAGTVTLTITTDVSWTVASDNSDFTVSPASGTGDGTVTVTYTENAGIYARTATITVSDGADLTSSVAITQNAPLESNTTITTDSVEMTIVDETVTASTESISYTFSDAGWDNSYVLTSDDPAVTLSDGTTISFAQNGGSSKPAYYTSNTAVRIYARNMMVVEGYRAIASITLTCISNYLGNDELYARVEDNTLAVVNYFSEKSSGGTQMRVVSITITYAE